MEKESLNNMGYLCKECSIIRHETWQRENKDTVINKGDYVKVCFTEGNQNEHMWIWVVDIMDDHIFGELDNDPVAVRNIKCGDMVMITREQIEDHLKKEN